jgi:hypothetical protein
LQRQGGLAQRRDRRVVLGFHLLGGRQFVHRRILCRRHHMLFLERLRLALRERSQRGLVELQRRVTEVEVMLLLLLLLLPLPLLCLEQRGRLGEYVGHLTAEDRVLVNG